MSKTKVALLGCGDVATRDYLPEMRRLADRMQVVAVCGRSAERARAVAADYGIDAVYAGYASLLAETDADVVVNLTPIQLHAETTLAALQAGKHVYSEKPVATTLQEAERIREEAQRRGLTLVCAPSVLLFPQVRKVRELLGEGAVGPVHSAVGHGHGGVPPWHGFPSDPGQFFAAGGGPVRDMGVYPLHVLTGLLGPVRGVTAMSARAQSSFVVPDGPFAGRTVPVEIDDNWHITLDFGDARLATLTANNVTVDTRRRELELSGLAGTIAFDLIDVSRPIDLRQADGWREVEPPRTGRTEGPDHVLGVEHLLDCLATGRHPELSIEHAVHVTEVIEAAARSAAEARHVPVRTTF